ncbi:MAG: DUF924 family protein [Neisseria sp.]|nr:DUF924 family protein [Neisseria sp.]
MDFWFDGQSRPYWFRRDSGFDGQIRARFAKLYPAAAGELYGWRTALAGRLAEIIVPDQFARNLFRNSPKAFVADNTALVLSQEAAAQPGFARLPPEYRHFMLMPLMHGESRAIHRLAEKLFAEHTDKSAYEFELKHKAAIGRFGRYPHRNAVLGRESTAEEAEFLKQPDSPF